jgi:hypothetical protein
VATYIRFLENLKLENFQGGLKLLDLNCNNIAQLRCASKLLEMNEVVVNGNFITKTEAFLMGRQLYCPKIL